MKKEFVIKAKTEEEAKTLALSQVNCSEEDVVITLIEKGKKGFFKTEPSTYNVSYVLSPIEAAKTFIDLIAKDLEIEIEASFEQGEDNNVTITLSGEGASTLIGHHGETLDSFQYIVNLVANKKDSETRPFTRFTVDIENYREKREEALKQLATRIAEKVIKTKRYVILEPMNAYERRIIHSTIQGVPGVSTNSIGPEGNRKVVVFLEGNQRPSDYNQRTRNNSRNGKGRRDNQKKSYQRNEESAQPAQTYRYNADKSHTPPKKIEKAKDLDSYFAKLKEFSISSLSPIDNPTDEEDEQN